MANLIREKYTWWLAEPDAHDQTWHFHSHFYYLVLKLVRMSGGFDERTGECHHHVVAASSSFLPFIIYEFAHHLISLLQAGHSTRLMMFPFHAPLLHLPGKDSLVHSDSSNAGWDSRIIFKGTDFLKFTDLFTPRYPCTPPPLCP